MERINAWNDMVFKFLLGKDTTSDILVDFINRVFLAKGLDKIVKATIRNPFNLKEFKDDKESILDIKAEDERGRLYDIEMQSSYHAAYVQRSIFYWANMYSSQLSTGQIYTNLHPVISINLINFKLFEQLDNYHNLFLLKEKDGNELLTDHLSLHYIEMIKMKKVESSLEKFIYFLLNEGKEDDMLEMLVKDDPVLKKTRDEYKKFVADEQLRYAYESREKYQRDHLTDLAVAREEEREKTKLEDANEMINEGFGSDVISRITKLPIDKINELKAELTKK